MGDVNAVAVRGLCKYYGHVRAVDDVSFELGPGRILALLGANGAGKSTTVHMLLGLLAPSGGTLAIAGHDVLRDIAAVRLVAAYVPDRLALYPHLTGLEKLSYFHQAGAGRSIGAHRPTRRACVRRSVWRTSSAGDVLRG
jgi:ABC-type multidrug transport system ATPase subunit